MLVSPFCEEDLESIEDDGLTGAEARKKRKSGTELFSNSH